MVFVRIKELANGRNAIQICETTRTGKTVAQKIVRHVGLARDDEEVPSAETSQATSD